MPRTVNVGACRAVAQFGMLMGADEARVDALMRNYTSAHIDPDERAPIELVVELWNLIEKSCPNVALGLMAADASAMTDFGVVGQLTRHASTVREMVEVNRRYHRLIDTEVDLQTFEREGTTVIGLSDDPDVDALRHPAEMGLAMVYRQAKSALAEDAKLHEVRFRHAACAPRDVYERYFGAPVHHRQTETCLVVDTTLLDRALGGGDAQLSQYLRESADVHLRKIDPDTPTAVTARVKHAIELGLDRGDASRRSAATHLGMSERSMQRALHAAGKSFSDILDEARLARARRLLKRDTLAIYEVAFLLGYGDTSAFNRAFKRWTGHTPRDFREHFERLDRAER